MRSPNDGKPYYCATCGLGWGEYMACEEPGCALESEETAAARGAGEPCNNPATVHTHADELSHPCKPEGFYDKANRSCQQMGDGTCQLAGTEECDECPYS